MGASPVKPNIALRRAIFVNITFCRHTCKFPGINICRDGKSGAGASPVLRRARQPHGGNGPERLPGSRQETGPAHPSQALAEAGRDKLRAGCLSKAGGQRNAVVRKCRTVHRYDCMVFADSSAFLRYSSNFPTIIVAISIIMLTFAKEGGGGTPPVPLEPSKKLHFAAFCFLLGFLPFYFLILHDAYNALNYINILLRVAVFLESNPALFYSFLREKFFFVKIENYTLGSLFSCLM